MWIFILVGLIAIAAYEFSGGIHGLVLHPFAQSRSEANLAGSQLLGAGIQHNQGVQQIYGLPFTIVTPPPIPGSSLGPLCDASLQGRCGICQKEVPCTYTGAANDSCTIDNYVCSEQ